MCGIAGILNQNTGRPPSETELSSMITQLRHRGPDGYGYFSDAHIGLAHARLSIIDLSGGTQPIHNEDRSVWVIFNGEIFNYIELRAQLESQGHVFYTHSDTEVIVHLYEQYGDEFVHHLNGQYAIALWDTLRRRLLLIRDRAGILPLFYTQLNQRLIFASEVKAILPVLGQAPRLNPDALDQIMTFWAPVSPDTIFENVHEVSPGCMLIVSGDSVRQYRYWDWSFPEDGKYHSGSVAEQAEQLRELLIDATRLRLRADVPVGAYLSGGLDSSVLAALIRNHSDVHLRTFSIGFEDRGFDESEYQNQMVTHLHTDHSQICCRQADIAAEFQRTIWHTESPILRTAPVPMGLLSGLVRAQGFKVVLTGEGADEVLGGYDIFKEAKIRRFWAKNPASVTRPLLLKRLYPYLEMPQGRAAAYLSAFFGMGIDRPDAAAFAHLPRWVSTAKSKEFFSPDLHASLRANAQQTLESRLPAALSAWHPFNRGQYIEAKSLMAGYLLCSQGDRMLMANSVEGRFPFLDHRVIEFANRVDPRLKMHVLQEKYLLKQAMRRYLPETILGRYKQPYRAPDIASFTGEKVPEFVADLMSETHLRRVGLFDAAKTARLVQKAQQGRAKGNKDNMAFVGILSTQLWHHLFVDNYSKTFLVSNGSDRVSTIGAQRVI